MGKLILILGGARSGKSTYAENLAKEHGGGVLYIATAEAKDEEMDARIEQHHANRPADWGLIETPRNVAQAIRQGRSGEKVVLVDCITFLVSNYLLAAAGPEDDPFDEPSADPFDERIEADVIADVEALAAYARAEDVTMLVVSNEVGMGLVPAYELGRAYRDILGRANQTLARHADEIFLLVAGIPMRVK
ncbi:MAG: bifunctional adenosylcobinamide kinase/adenosylcobinamide-phosphate guanylyltransferase [Chloroflexota bacterium]|nr:bifunctional adenosylcobinamide kinase/adenosylcobinamide-phosphate guanylyltransferase [Chloroflexota bacterium]